jgi:CheY-like chemotaxis protein
MGGDLVSLRMLVVAADEAGMALWLQAAGMATVPLECSANDAASAATAIASGGTDICIVDSRLAEADKVAVIAAARATPRPPLIFMSAPAGSPRPEGVNGTLPRPSSLDAARKAVEICVRTKIPTRVLIVDDSSTMRSIVRKILSQSCFTLDMHEAAEGIAALNELRSGRFSVVFLDYNMPGLNGFETLSEIKRENPDVAVVIMTSTVDKAIADRAHQSGALAFLKKPFYPADIDKVLERYYGLHPVASATPVT